MYKYNKVVTIIPEIIVTLELNIIYKINLRYKNCCYFSKNILNFQKNIYVDDILPKYILII